MNVLSNLSQFPTDHLIELALTLTITDLLNLCSTNKYVNRVCNNQFFWKLRL